MRGHIRKRVRNTTRGQVVSWHPIVYLGRDPVTQAKRYKEGRGYRSRREAEAALNQMLADLGSGSFVSSSSLTLTDYLLDLWLPTVASRVKPTTFNGYCSVVERYLLPLLGQMKIQDLTPAHLNAAYAKLLRGEVPPPRRTRKEHPVAGRSYRPRESKPLAPKTILNAHLVLSKALEDAVDSGLLLRNPARRAKPPRVPKKEIASWTPSELGQFLQWASSDDRSGLWHLLAMTGLRRGEALAIRFGDVDFENHRIAVRQNLVLVRGGEMRFVSPKSDRPRVVDIDQQTVSVLRRQNAAVLKQRLSWGPVYQDLDLVFPSADGSPQRPDVVSRVFSRLVSGAMDKGVVTRRITLHGLRHTHATIGISAGVPVKVMSERLGHASPAFTMSAYQHVLPTMQREAAITIAGLVGLGTGTDDARP